MISLDHVRTKLENNELQKSIDTCIGVHLPLYQYAFSEPGNTCTFRTLRLDVTLRCLYVPEIAHS